MKKLIFILASLSMYLNISFAQVSQQWASIYNGKSNRVDKAVAMVLDDSGNVYVTGFSEVTTGNGTDYDYLTIKYNSTGIQQWAASYSGPGKDDDKVISIGIDGLNNVYVTGYSGGTGYGDDYLTIKYNSSGEEIWVRRYSGPIDSTDQANALFVDFSGNVYVTGYSQGSLTGLDIATIKYNTDGDLIWVNRFNSFDKKTDIGRAIVADNFGNVYVTGHSTGFTLYSDYVTIKYNSSGVIQWVEPYNGSGAGDNATLIALDTSGNVYVTGNSTGNASENDYATIKYNSSGSRQWVKRYDGLQHGNDFPNSLFVDVSGNVYVTGHSVGFAVGYDYATIKYNTAGVQKWVARYNGTGNNEDIAHSIAVDEFYNVYITGNSLDSSHKSNCTTIKYDSSGSEKWIERFVGVSGGNSRGVAIKVDNSGNIFETGYTDGNGTQIDFLTIKYSLLTELQINSDLNPNSFSLSQNYPNPFNPKTIINYELGIKNFVSLKVYDVLGNEVRTLVNENKPAGSYSVEFDGSNFSSGVYFYKLEAGDFIETKRMVLLK